MAPKGAGPRQAVANRRLTRPISSMADALLPPVSVAACSGVIAVRLEQLAAPAQSKDWQKHLLPQPPLWVSCGSGDQTTPGLAAA
jgi:hypothetical protein